MAAASYLSQAYAQALMHMEMHIRSYKDREDAIRKEDLDMLRQIYPHMDDSDSMEAIFEFYSQPLSVQETVSKLVSGDHWNDAKAFYEDIQRWDDPKEAINGLFQCYNVLGDYGKCI